MVRILRSLVTFVVLAVFLVVPGSASVVARTRGVLVLYDSNGPYGRLGEQYSVLLQNLLGHFDVRVTSEPVTSYAAGQMQVAATTFYIGSTYDEPFFQTPASPGRAAYDAFLADAATGRSDLVWMGANLNLLAWKWRAAWGPSFQQRFGFTFDGLSNAGGYDRVIYKNTELDKGMVRHPAGGNVSTCTKESDGYACATSLGLITVTDPSRARVFAQALSTTQSKRAPYVTRGGNLWYVGDIPFEYTSEEDRYLAIADLLHDMLGISHHEVRRALIRLEDVSAWTDREQFATIARTLGGMGVPFSVALVPFYRDPATLGAQTEDPVAGTSLGRLLRTLQDSGKAFIVQHGTTHQLGVTPNPYSGATGDDFEFLRVTLKSDGTTMNSTAVPGDSAAWASARVRRGRDSLASAGLHPIAFEAPHYGASLVDYRAIASLYPVSYGRALYYTSAAGPTGQFFPYAVKDVYGERVIPEDLGSISPEPWNTYPASLPADVIARASKELVVRDSVASFFFHPYLPPALLVQTIRGLQDLGYEFVSPCDVVAC